MPPRTTSAEPAPERRAPDRRHGAPRSRHRRPPTVGRRPQLFLGVAAAGAIVVHVLLGADPAAQAEAARTESASVAEQLGLTAQSDPIDISTEDLQPLEQLAASRATREADESAAVRAQAAADQVARDRQKAVAEAAAKAKAEAAAKAAKAAEAAAATKSAEQSAAAGSSAASAAAALPDAVAQITNSAGPVSAHVQTAANTLVSNVPGVAGLTLGGTRSSATDPHGHPSGNALDYMVLTDSALGDAIVQYHIDHWADLHVEYIIWQQRILQSPGGSWSFMADRGSPTANHMDHVHVNYLP